MSLSSVNRAIIVAAQLRDLISDNTPPEVREGYGFAVVVWSLADKAYGCAIDGTPADAVIALAGGAQHIAKVESRGGVS